MTAASTVGVQRIALPAISCGVYGFPLLPAARIALAAAAAAPVPVRHVTMMLFGNDTMAAFLEAAEEACAAGSLQRVQGSDAVMAAETASGPSGAAAMSSDSGRAASGAGAVAVSSGGAVSDAGAAAATGSGDNHAATAPAAAVAATTADVEQALAPGGGTGAGIDTEEGMSIEEAAPAEAAARVASADEAADRHALDKGAEASGCEAPHTGSLSVDS